MSKKISEETENRYLFYMTIIGPVIEKIEEEDDFLSMKEIIPFERVRRLPKGKDKIVEVMRAFTHKESISNTDKPEEAMLLEAMKKKHISMQASYYGPLWKISVQPIEAVARVQKDQDYYTTRWQGIQRYLTEVQHDIHEGTEYDLDADEKKHLNWIIDILVDPEIGFENCKTQQEVTQKMLNKIIESEHSHKERNRMR